MSRFGYLTTGSAAVTLLVALTLISFTPKLIWNASASTPIGLYTIDPAQRPQITDLVAVRAPEPLSVFMANRGYIARGVPLLKRVAALPGQKICRTGLIITVDAVPLGQALERDHANRPLPTWQGCHVLVSGEIFLMNWQVEESLDGRYFGALPASAVIGRATPLYTDEDGDGRFVWHARTR